MLNLISATFANSSSARKAVLVLLNQLIQREVICFIRFVIGQWNAAYLGAAKKPSQTGEKPYLIF